MGSARAFLLMREIALLGHRCVILTSDSNHLTTPPRFDGPVFSETVDNVDVHWLRTLKFNGAGSVRRILSWLHFEWRLWRTPKKHIPRPDVIIVSSPSLLTIGNGLLLRWRYGCRLVFEVRDIWPLTLTEEGAFSRWNPFIMAFRLIETIGYRCSDVIVGTMPNLVQHVRESIGTVHPPVGCIPFGVHSDMERDAQLIPQAWLDEHVPSGKFIVCHAGAIGISNALDTLFKCARSLVDHPDVHFLIVGEGGLRSRYQAENADLPNVTFTGPVPKDMVASALDHCDLLYFSVHPSKVWDYGLSLNKVIDYMLAAKPIVASYTGYPSMVDEAGAGLSAPAGDEMALKAAILRFRQMTAAKRQEIGEAGRRWLLENRSYKKIAQDYVALCSPATGRVQTDDIAR